MIDPILTCWLMQVHVLIVQGYGSVLGLSSPSSYIVQELLLNFWPARRSNASILQSMQRVILSSRPSDADRKFVLDISIDADRWWENIGNDNPLPTFEELDQRFTVKADEVCHITMLNELHIFILNHDSTLPKGVCHPHPQS